jgi:hypothetical protein
MISKQAIAELVNKHCITYDLRPDVVVAIIIQESKGDTFAWRWEEKFYETKLKDKKRGDLAGFVPAGLPSFPDELLQRSCSYGLMQVLGDTARWCAKVQAPYLTALCDPDRGIEAGCRVLSFYLARANNDYHKALTGYNGSPIYPIEVFSRIERGEHFEWFQGE